MASILGLFTREIHFIFNIHILRNDFLHFTTNVTFLVFSKDVYMYTFSWVTWIFFSSCFSTPINLRNIFWAGTFFLVYFLKSDSYKRNTSFVIISCRFWGYIAFPVFSQNSYVYTVFCYLLLHCIPILFHVSVSFVIAFVISLLFLCLFCYFFVSVAFL